MQWLGLGWPVVLLSALLMFGLSVADALAGEHPKHWQVRASAYNSLPAQTNSQPTRAAWGDELKPGMKVIAVSRDLLSQGLHYGDEVTIEGLKGHYRVIDKMHRRWRHKIDIYMGKDVKAARAWGVRKVEIRLVSPHPRQ